MTAAVACGSTKPPVPQAAGPVVEITIAHGSVTPTNATLTAKVGQPITLRVNSDTDDELHVHSTPDHEFEVVAKPEQEFSFTVDVPGSVAVELHHLDRTVATIQVQP
ncbi:MULTISPECIES: cupredoxin domain-containing protein [Mycobacteriaceae]|uniref:cupredoxin domain-containing protein n=1 Tax=Mycobacteriaceae TaxID=1762 RepID=UPI002107F3DA|nr:MULTISPECIES: cupredoxin domain-containing protein [Mycobacteriaceae]